MPLFFKSFFSSLNNFLVKEKNLFLFLGLLTVFVSLIRYVGHSEFWSVYYSKYFFADGYFHDSLYSKSIFHLSLVWIHWLPIGNLTHLFIAKFIYGFIALSILFTTYKIFRLRLSEKYSAVLLSGLFFNGTVFWDLMQIKSDITCLLFLLLGFYFFQKKLITTSVFLFFLAILSTPKAIIFLPFPILIILNQIDWKISWNFRSKLWLLRCLTLFLTLFTILYFYRDGRLKSILFSTYKMAFRYGDDLLKEGLRVGSQEFNSFYPINFIYWILPTIVIYILFSFKIKFVSMSHAKKITFLGLFLYSALATWFYPIKLPHFLIPLFFFLVIAFVYFANFVPSALEGVAKIKIAFRYLVIFYFVSNFFQCVRFFNSNWGGNQFELLSQINILAGINPAASIVDGTGALPRANNLPIFFGLYDNVGNTIAAQQIMKVPPDLIFFTPKISLGIGWFKSYFDENYILLAPNVYTKKVQLADIKSFDPMLILKDLKLRFQFPIQQISFRVTTGSDTVAVLPATCLPRFVEKEAWPIEEFKNCSTIVFNKFPEGLKPNTKLMIYASPWPDIKELSTDLMSSQLNYKNN